MNIKSMMTITMLLMGIVPPVSSSEEVKRCLAQFSGKQNPPSTSNRKPSVGWGTTTRGWGRDDEISEGSK